jgi:hypothetical protein
VENPPAQLLEGVLPMRIPICLNEYANLLDARVRFLQANYGDGEWACILGHPGKNCNGEDYTPELQAALEETIAAPPPGHVWYGSNGGVKLEPSIMEWLLARNLTQRAWVYKEIISGANANGKMGPLIAAIRRRRTILVGPEHLNNAELYKIFNIKGQVVVPTSNAYTVIETTYTKTLALQKQHIADLILVCSGMAANPLIHRVGAIVPNVTIIDMGATLDPYAGIYSRNAYRKEEFQKSIFAKNLHGIVDVL